MRSEEDGIREKVRKRDEYREQKGRTVVYKFLGNILAITLLWLGTIAAAGAQEGVIKVGAIFPLSGGSGPQGQHIVQSLKAMVEMINEEGGVNGKRLVLEARDDESTPAVGVSRANELITAGVAVIIEGWNSPVTLAMQPVISRADILDITALSKADTILSGEGNPLAIRLNSSNTQDGEIIAEMILKESRGQRIAFMLENDLYGIGAQAAIEDALKARGHAYEKVAEEKFPLSQADFRVAMTNVASAKPDVTVMVNANEGVGLPSMIRQARQSRLGGEILIAVGTMAPSVVKIAGKSADGVLGADIYFPEAEPFASDPRNKAYMSKMQKMHGTVPDKFMAVSALALEVWAQAANELKTLDRTLLAKRIRGGKFNGTIMGDMEFAENGQLISRYYRFKVESGEMKVMP